MCISQLPLSTKYDEAVTTSSMSLTTLRSMLTVSLHTATCARMLRSLELVSVQRVAACQGKCGATRRDAIAVSIRKKLAANFYVFCDRRATVSWCRPRRRSHI